MIQQSRTQKVLHLPLTKITLGLVFCIAISVIGQLTFGQLLKLTSLDKEIRNLIINGIGAACAILSYRIFFKFYEKREISELSLKGIGGHLVTGVLLGGLLQSLTILVIYLNGSFTIVSVNPFSFMLPAFVMACATAIVEEILVRGIIFRIMEKKLGSYLALFISALIFGAMHLANPNSSRLVALGLAIQAGLLLAAAYIYTRNLWFPIALHFAWNFTQSGIFGANTSGNAVSKSLFASKIQGAEWLTGGQFGPEGSIQATVFCLIATIILMVLSHKQNRIIKPYWKQ